MSVTITKDTDFPVRPDPPYIVETVKIVTTANETTGSFTTRLNRPEGVRGPAKGSISGSTVSYTNLPAASGTYYLEVFGRC